MQAGLGIEQELRSGGDTLAGAEAMQHFSLSIRLAAEMLDSLRLAPTLFHLHDAIALAATDHRRARHQHHFVTERLGYLHARAEPGPQAAVTVSKTDPQPDAARGAIGRRQEATLRVQCTAARPSTGPAIKLS